MNTKYLRWLLIATFTFLALLVIGASIAHSQANPIVSGTNSDFSREWGGFQFRYWKGHPAMAAITANNIKNGDGLDVILREHTAARDRGEFTVHRTMYNYHKTNRANAIGATFKEMTHWDGSRGWIIDYDRAQNLVIIEGIEMSVRDKSGHKIDAVQLGFGLLGENNFGPNPPPVSLDGMFGYYLVMNRVWGAKLQICIGGAYGSVANPAWTRKILTRIAETGRSFLGQFQDNYGREHWENNYHFPAEIWDDAGVDRPIITWLEVTGNANQWDIHPTVEKTSAQLYAEFVDRQYSFLHNMARWPNYAGTNAFIQNVLAYLPQQVAEYRAAVGGSPIDPPPIDPPDSVATLSDSVAVLWEQMDAWNEWLKLAPTD